MADTIKTKLLEKALLLHILAIQDNVLWDFRFPHTWCDLPGIPTLSVSLHLARSNPPFRSHLDPYQGEEGRAASPVQKWLVLYRTVFQKPGWPLCKAQNLRHYRWQLLGSLNRKHTHSLQKPGN